MIMMTRKIIFYCCVFMMSIIKTNAQTEKSKLKQTDSTLMYVNGEGTFLHLGKAEGTRMNLLTTIQSGFQVSQFDSVTKSNTNRLSLNMVRIAFTASGYKDKMSMGVVTDFTGVSPILEGWIGFSVYKKSAKVILGQRQTNTNNRLALADERYSSFMGQTIAGKSNDGTVYGGLMQNFVGSTREGGLYFESNFSFKKCRIYPSVSITTGEGQNFFSTQTNLGFKYGGRLDIMPLGDFIKNNAFIAQDIYRESKPKLGIGIAASINKKASSIVGTDHQTITGIYNKVGEDDYADYRKLAADFIFKYKGFSLVGEYMSGTVTGEELYTDKVSINKLTEDIASQYYNLGTAINFQTSYVFKNGWAIDGRYGTVTPEFDITSSLVQKQTWLSGGINKFIKNNAVKLGLNFTQIKTTSSIITTTNTIGNLAIQILM